MLEKLERLVLLNDFYGPLLTERQQQVTSMHYEDDMSLSEIAEETSITRQAVHDLLKRTENALEEYESRLGLVAKHLKERAELEKAFSILIHHRCERREEIEPAIEIIQKLLTAENTEEGSGTRGI